MSGKKFYFPNEQGGITFKTERQVGHVRIPNYVYDLWLPILGVTAIGVYSVYCRLERAGTCKGMTQRRLAKMCQIGARKLSVINESLQEHGFVRIKKPAGKARLMHYSTEITIIDPPRELSKKVIDAVDGYEPLSPWLLESPKTSNDASLSTENELSKAPPSAPKVGSLCLNTSDVEGNPPAQKFPIGESSQPKPQPNTNPSPQQPQATDPATPGGQPDSDTITDAQDTLYSAVAPGEHPDDNIPKFQTVPGVTALSEPGDSTAFGDGLSVQPLYAGDTTSVDPPARVPALDDLPVLSAIFGYPEPPRNYLTDLFNHANRDKPGDSDTHIRPKHWQTVSDDEYAICRRVADLWCGGRLPYPGSIEAHCGAAGWLLHDLNGGNLSACIRVLDEYHRYYEDEQMTFTVAGPKSLVAVLPAFLAQSGSGGEAGVIRLGG